MKFEDARENVAVTLTATLVGVMFTVVFLLIALLCFPSFVGATFRRGPRATARSFQTAIGLAKDAVSNALHGVGIAFKEAHDEQLFRRERQKYWRKRSNSRLSDKEIELLDFMEKMQS